MKLKLEITDWGDLICVKEAIDEMFSEGSPCELGDEGCGIVEENLIARLTKAGLVVE